MECNHLIIEEGICRECGMATNMNGTYLESQTYLTNHSTVNVNNTFENDLRCVILPTNIKEEIINLSKDVTNITRKNIRKKVLFSLAYTAYLNLDISFDPEELAKIFKLNSNDYTAAIKLISGINPNISISSKVIPIAIINPVTYFPTLINKLQNFSGVSIDEKDLKDIFTQVETNEPTKIYNFQPKHVAIAIIKYYLDREKITVNKFQDCYNMTTATINKHVNIIKKILESPL